MSPTHYYYVFVRSFQIDQRGATQLVFPLKCKDVYKYFIIYIS